MADDGIVTLQSQDGQDFTAEVKVVKMSTTIANLIEDAGVTKAIPLPNVSGKILAKVVEYCKFHTENPAHKDEEKRTDDLSDWDKAFCAVDQATLFEIILAANYLDIGALLNVTCKTVANMIKGKTPEEIRKTFNIKNDFTPEEEKQVALENQWAHE